MKLVHVALTLSITVGLASCKDAPKAPKLGHSKGAIGFGGGEGDPLVCESDEDCQETPEGGPNVQGGDLSPEAAALSLKAPEAGTAFPRLSHSQWENAVRDLLKLSANPGLSQSFPSDSSASTFDNLGVLLKVSPNLWLSYAEAAEKLGLQIGKDKNAYSKLIPSGKTDATSIVTSFLRSAYRRPATAAEVSSMVATFNKGASLTGISDAQGAGIAAMITTTLQSPYFVYLTQTGESQADKTVSLSAWEVASRLSFGIWNSTPDAALLDAAASGEILKSAGLRAQAKRLLADPRANANILRLTMRNFNADNFTPVKLNATQFPESQGLTADILRSETEMFLSDILFTQNKGIKEILTAPYAFVSSKTAAAYEVNQPSETPKKTALNPAQRAGILTQVPFLTTYGRENGVNAIIKRGHYVTEKILCLDTPAVPVLPSDVDAKSFKTDRDYVNAMTSPAGCASCHAKKLNPPGFGLENLGPAGKWRNVELSGNTINSASELFFGGTDSIKFDGPVAMIQDIGKRPEIHQCYTRHMMEALYGRSVDQSDAELITELSKKSEEGLSAKDIILEILSSKAMGIRRAP